MDGNDRVAQAVEQRAGVRTWSTEEMGFLLAALCTDEARELASAAPMHVDLSCGLADVEGLGDLVRDLHGEATHKARVKAAEAALVAAERSALGATGPQTPMLSALPRWSRTAGVEPTAIAGHGTRLEDLVVIVGIGEVGPCGSARTRHALEVSDTLSPAAVLELAWTTGLVRFDDRVGSWTDVATQEPVAESELVERYGDAVKERVGIRFTEPETVGFDPERVEVLATAWLDRDFRFPVSNEAEARCFERADPEHTRVGQDADGAWWVTRTAGAVIRVPKSTRISRRVAGQLPRGFDLTRLGLPAEMVERVDRISLLNLVATVEAFLSAGITPEELLSHVHPAKVASTQGAGIGGMDSLRRLYQDPVLDADRQRDILQETLINVVASYATQAYVGGYGAQAAPVAACATAAVSLEQGVDRIRLGKADFVVAGAVDDLGLAGVQGFGDMNATADTDEMLSMGLEPNQMSRSNDVRRRGFVESHGGGAVLLTRGDIAAELGLPVHGVVGWAGTFGDGIHPSVPAPGLGALAAACGGKQSPLGAALAAHGLSADDISVVSKHDTSTGANDPNESELHETIQRALGRTPGNPLFVVSQKTLTGHSKGGAAAWQLNGLCQMLQDGVVPPNRNLESVDPVNEDFQHLLFTDTPLAAPKPFAAGLLTSLGFGHVSAIALVLHPDVFHTALKEEQREAYTASAAQRLAQTERTLMDVWMGRTALYERRSDRRLSETGPSEQAMLLDPSARLGSDGTFTVA
jgi:fatty acid synthase